MTFTDPDISVTPAAPDRRTALESAHDTAAKVGGTVATSVIRILLGGIMGVVISRALEPDGRGVYSMVVVIATVAIVLGHLSIGQAAVSFWSSSRVSLPTNSLIVGPPLGVAAALLVGLVVMLLGPGIVPLPRPDLLVLALVTAPVGVVVIHLTIVTLLLGRVDVVNRSLMVSAFLQCGSLAGFAWAGALSTTVVVWVWAICGAIPLLFMLPILRPHLGPADFTVARRMLADGAQYHVGVIGLFLLLRTDVLILNALAPVAAVGLYTLAVSVGEMTFAGTDALTQVLMPRQAESGMGAAGDLTVKTMRLALLIAAASVAAICIVAPFVVPLLYGEAFRESVAPLFALAPGLVAYGAVRALSPYLLRLGRPRLMSAISVVALAVNVTLNLLLIPRLGIVGCALATSAGYLAYSAGHVAWFTRSARVAPSALVPGVADARLILAAVRQGVRSRR